MLIVNMLNKLYAEDDSFAMEVQDLYLQGGEDLTAKPFALENGVLTYYGHPITQ